MFCLVGNWVANHEQLVGFPVCSALANFVHFQLGRTGPPPSSPCVTRLCENSQFLLLSGVPYQFYKVTLFSKIGKNYKSFFNNYDLYDFLNQDLATSRTKSLVTLLQRVVRALPTLLQATLSFPKISGMARVEKNRRHGMFAINGFGKKRKSCFQTNIFFESWTLGAFFSWLLQLLAIQKSVAAIAASTTTKRTKKNPKTIPWHRCRKTKENPQRKRLF